MARKKKQGGVETLMELAALLPWWAAIALGAVSYFALHRMAVMPKVESLQAAQGGGFVIQAFIANVALFGQYLIPFFCLVGALVSFLKRRKRAGLVLQVADSPAAEALNGMSWREFEMLVGEAFRLQGWQVSEQGGAGADGGVDLMLRKDGETFLVQCKQWKAFSVGVQIVRELYGVMAARGAAGGYVITSGKFTAEARAWVEGRNIRLVDGRQLFEMIGRGTASMESKPDKAAFASATPVAPTAPDVVCPVCAAPMVRRTARKGINAGTQFWGCSRYPSCRGTR